MTAGQRHMLVGTFLALSLLPAACAALFAYVGLTMWQSTVPRRDFQLFDLFPAFVFLGLTMMPIWIALFLRAGGKPDTSRSP